MKAIINAKFYDFESYKKNQFIIFDKKIIKIGEMSDFIDNNFEIYDGTNYLVMPSLINAHNHIYSTFSRGIDIKFNPKNFQDILDQLWWKIDKNLDLDNIYYSGLINSFESIKNGITTIIDHHASGCINNSLETLKKAVCDKAGIRGVFCFETSDRFDIDKCINENISFINNNNSTISKGLFGMHALMSLSENSLKKISKNINNNPIHIHIAESKMDEHLSYKKYNKSVINKLNDYKLLTKNSLLIHCVHINEEEAKIISDSKCKVVLNITSNMNNGVSLPDYKLFKKYNISVLIGNDGISSNITSEYKNLYYAMHLKYNSPTAFTFNDLIEIINNNYLYASELLNCKLGKIKEDFESDLLMIPYNSFTEINKKNIFSHIFFGIFDNFKPKYVWCKGKIILNDYKIVNPIENLYKDSKKSADKLWERIK